MAGAISKNDVSSYITEQNEYLRLATEALRSFVGESESMTKLQKLYMHKAVDNLMYMANTTQNFLEEHEMYPEG